ncbi:germination protein YpeB [Virgibacillus alimentarius]|uniref:Spore germination protein n=1 Tax=Virgibacillus alimentarius TaxID=698769 RepID=A0ABS4S5Q8_9BACI|nr:MULTISPECIES: germination protein YpeB [Virgibacillus]MBP2256396.1 spore germination protein [Virgibacillus alimentarius]HLR66341.1 germination protein YpeB [Virgibacillus sp.]
MIRWILITILTLGIAGTAYWGYQEHQEKNAVLIQAENTYQRSFHDLSYRMDLLHDKIGTTLAMDSNEILSPQLVEIWRLTSEAQADVGQLPLSLLPFNKTEEFLSKIGDFTYRTAVRDLEKDPLSKKESKSLKNLYKQAGEIKDELREVQHLTLKNNLRWMDVELALATQEEPADNTIIDGFETVEKKVEGFAEANQNSSINGDTNEDKGYKYITGKKINKQKALDRSKKIFNVSNENNLKITNSGKGSEIPLYSISYKNGDKSAYMDMSQKGGHPISLLVNRDVKDKKISLNEGQERAEEYIKQFDFENMTVYQSSEYDNVGVYSFLYEDDDVHVYPDSLEVKVALDNGDILGFNARNYLKNHTDRDISKPKLSQEEAREKVNSQVKINEESLAMIENEMGEEVLVYEFLGVLNNETYRIFINAMDGKEEKVEKLNGKEINFASTR